MTVFGVLNFGDQGNTACVNIYMHVMSNITLFFICFLPFITIQYMEIFLSILQNIRYVRFFFACQKICENEVFRHYFNLRPSFFKLYKVSQSN